LRGSGSVGYVSLEDDVLAAVLEADTDYFLYRGAKPVQASAYGSNWVMFLVALDNAV